MISFILPYAFVGLIFYKVYQYMFYKPPNFPPGPPRIPLLGSYPLMLLLNFKHMHKAIDMLCKYYKTDILGLYAATFPTIVCNTERTARESLNNADIDGKPQLLLARMRDPEFQVRGIFFTEGKVWHEQRRFFLRHIRDFGFGRRFNDLEIDINCELTHFIDMIKNGPKFDYEKQIINGDKIHCPGIFTPVYGNIFLKVLINERYTRDKQSFFYEARKWSYAFSQKADDWGRMFSYVEWIAKVFPNISDFNALKEMNERLYNCIKILVDDQYKTFDPSHERHFLDIYFKKMHDSHDEKENSFIYKQLVMLCVDVFIPALNANSITTHCLIQRLYFHPEVMKKCHEEIDRVVGQGRLPSLNDRVNMPYVEATLRETMRHMTLVPSGLPHVATKDTKLMNYDVPKGTIVFSSLNSVNNDPSVFKDADIFNPGRFFDENGNFSLKLDKSLPFGAGKRVCAGETFARNTFFLVASAFIQNFTFEMPPNERMPNYDETNTGIIITVPEFWLKIEAR